jgi:hypothetical protein
MNRNGEIASLDSFFGQLKKLEKRNFSLGVPSVLRGMGIFKMNISLEAYRTHHKTVRFLEISPRERR